MKKYKVMVLEDGYMLMRYGKPMILFDTLTEAASFAYILEHPNQEDDPLYQLAGKLILAL